MIRKKTHETLWLDREISWLEFNNRVMALSSNEHIPLLERLRFLAISCKNLDEFYMVRVAGLKSQLHDGLGAIRKNGQTLENLLSEIERRVVDLVGRQQHQYTELRRELKKHHYDFLEPDELNVADKKWLREHFFHEIFPILTPLAVDPAHPFPFIPSLSITIAVDLSDKHQKEHMGLVSIPPQIPHFIRIPGTSPRYVSTESLVRFFLADLFPGLEILASGAFRVLRDSDLEYDEESEDFVRLFEASLKKRKRGAALLLFIDKKMNLKLRRFIEHDMQVTDESLIMVDGEIALSYIDQAIDKSMPELLYPPFQERFPERVREHKNSIFSAVKAKDILVHHPYESFDVVVQFLEEAAADPKVVSIKQTLYRTSNNSPIVAALIKAAENGKNVTAVVEIKARFDEEANIQWANNLKKSGVTVLYGLLGLKTHAKICLITRRETQGLNVYTHLATGNYHPVTARVYDDLSFFTCDPLITEDVTRIFNFVTSCAKPEKLHKLSYSPVNLRNKLISLIRREIKNAKNGQPACMWAKINSLVDKKLIDVLYEASQAGVSIDLIIRGICSLRPGIPGISDNIRVHSIVGRFLEHSRIVCFGNGSPLPSPHAKVFISSADWMTRNFDWRIETLIPIDTPTIKEQILTQIMGSYLKDRANSWALESDGTYRKLSDLDKSFNAHQYFIKTPSLSGRGHAKTKDSDKTADKIVEVPEHAPPLTRP